MENPNLDLGCPRCGSQDTRKLSLVHAEGLGTLSGSVSTAGIGVARGGVGVGVASSNIAAVHQSELSKLVAPPRPKNTAGPKVLAAVVTWLVTFSLFVWFNFFVPGAWLTASVIALVVAWAVPEGKNEIWNRTELPRLTQRWNNSYLCRRCSEIFDGNT